MALLLFLGLISERMNDMTIFGSAVYNRYHQDTEADSKMMTLGETIGSLAAQIQVENLALRAIHSACLVSPQGIAAYQTAARAIVLQQETLLRQIKSAHVFIRSATSPEVSPTFRTPAPCGLPGVLMWRRNIVYELTGDGYGIRAEQTSTGAKWYFYNPEVKAL